MRASFLALASCLAISPVRAQGGGELARCVSIDDDAQRLACYDRLFRSSAPAAAPAAAPGAAPAPEQDPEKVREVRARVTKVDVLRNGALVLTLDNGQVWRQNEPTITLQFKEADEVVIRAGMLGSYLLRHAEGKTTTRVTRTK